MAKDEDSKEKRGKGSGPQEIDLEKTTLDIDIRKLDQEAEEELEKTVIRKVVPEDDSGFHELGEKTLIHAAPPEMSSERIPGVGPPPSKKPIPPKQAKTPVSPRPRGKPGYSTPYLFLSLVIFLVLAAGLLEAMRQGGPLKLPGVILSAFSFLILAGSLLKRWDSKKGFIWIGLAWFGFVSYAGFLNFTSETIYFLNFTLNSLMGIFLVVASGVIPIFLWSEKKISFFPKAVAMTGWLILLLAFVFNLFSGRTFETGIWGPPFFSDKPLYLRPGILALSLTFPMEGFSVLWSSFYGKKRRISLPILTAVPLFLLSLMGTLLGAKLLFRQGILVPLLGRVVQESFSGTTIIDPNSSSLRLFLTDGRPVLGRDDVFHLEVAASQSVSKGKQDESWLMVRNRESRPFADSDVNQHLLLIRGGKKIKGGIAKLIGERLGQPRNLVLLIDVPSVMKPQVKASLTGAIYRLARQMDKPDRLLLLSGSGTKILSGDKENAWKALVDKSLQPKELDVPKALTQAYKEIANRRGLKQILYLGEKERMPSPSQRQEWRNQAEKGKVLLSFLALGAGNGADQDIYQVENPAAYGVQLLSAAASILGDYSLSFPTLPALPKIKLSKDAEGQLILKEGKVEFEISASSPSDIASLQFKIDNEKPTDLNPARFKQTVDLSTLKIKPGRHNFEVLLNTQEGDNVAEGSLFSYFTKKPLQFVKPLDKDSVYGIVSVLFSPGVIGEKKTFSVELLVDGIPAGKVTSPPYFISLDTSMLTEGEHALQGIQTFSDGTIESVQIKIFITPQAQQIKIVRPSNGELLSNLAEIEAEVGGGLLEPVKKVDFYLDGNWIGESNQPPFHFLWANYDFPAGQYFIQARALTGSQTTTTDAVQVQLAQSEITVRADPNLSPNGRLFPDNVLVLVDASASMDEPLGRASKLDMAKFSLLELAESLPKGVNLITRVFGGSSNSIQKVCRESLRLRNTISGLENVSARGTSPLAFALEQIGKDLKNAKGSRVGLLITDGWDDCGGDPIEVAQRLAPGLAKNKERLRLNIISFNEGDSANESLLKRLAEVTGGRVYSVKSQEDFLTALRDAIQVNFSLFDYKNTPVVEQALSDQPIEIRAGEYNLEIDTAPPLRKEKLILSPGAKKILTLAPVGAGFEIKEK